MGGGLVISGLMLAEHFTTVVGWVGVAANILLLVGDFGSTGHASKPLATWLAACLAAGYLGLLVWFASVAAIRSPEPLNPSHDAAEQAVSSAVG